MFVLALPCKPEITRMACGMLVEQGEQKDKSAKRRCVQCSLPAVDAPLNDSCPGKIAIF